MPQWSAQGAPRFAHAAGCRAWEIAEAVRARLAALVEADLPSVVLTSGATESKNLVTRGLVSREGATRVTSAVEHACVCEAMCDLARAERG